MFFFVLMLNNQPTNPLLFCNALYNSYIVILQKPQEATWTVTQLLFAYYILDVVYVRRLTYCMRKYYIFNTVINHWSEKFTYFLFIGIMFQGNVREEFYINFERLDCWVLLCIYQNKSDDYSRWFFNHQFIWLRFRLLINFIKTNVDYQSWWINSYYRLY